jgi:hypothetical protein
VWRHGSSYSACRTHCTSARWRSSRIGRRSCSAACSGAPLNSSGLARKRLRFRASPIGCVSPATQPPTHPRARLSAVFALLSIRAGVTVPWPRRGFVLIPSQEHLIDENTSHVLLCNLVTVVFGYVYDHRMTAGEPNVESAWLSSVLSPTLSWLEDISSVELAVTAWCVLKCGDGAPGSGDKRRWYSSVAALLPTTLAVCDHVFSDAACIAHLSTPFCVCGPWRSWR